MDRLLAAALAVNQDNLALGNETLAVAGGRFVRNTALPNIWDANHVDRITASSPQEIEALIERARREYAHCEHLRFDVDPLAPPAFEARLQLEPSLSRSELLAMVLEGEPRGETKPFEILPIIDEAGWAAFNALRVLDWAEGQARLSRAGVTAGPEIGAALARGMRAKVPPVRFWLGYIDGAPRGYLSSWEGTSGVGQVESLFVEPAFRHRGLATALLHHCVRDCRTHGAGPVVLVADAADTPKHMYAAMGWRPLAVIREYRIARLPSG